MFDQIGSHFIVQTYSEYLSWVFVCVSDFVDNVAITEFFLDKFGLETESFSKCYLPQNVINFPPGYERIIK